MRLERFGVKADSIRDVVVTHLHYDHAGNLDRFPNARFHLQDREMSYATGRCMCIGVLRHPFSVEHVTLMVRHVYGERVTFHSGDGEVAPGVTRASRRRPFRRPAGGAGRDRARPGGAGVGCRALLRQSASPQSVSDRLQYRRHGAGLGNRRAAGRPSRPLHSRPRSDRRARSIRAPATRSMHLRCT